MWNLQHLFRNAIGHLVMHNRRYPWPNASLDWLPPVLGPQDWQSGLFADREAAWYFDRDRN